jgi:hypothetical protein
MRHDMIRRTGLHHRTLALALWAALALPGIAHAQVTDVFGSPTIDLAKWEDANSNVVRRLNGGKLESSLTRFGPARANSLLFADPGSVQSMQAKVTVTDATLVSPSASGSTFLRARVHGGFYNNGTAGPGFIGDIQARIELRVDPIAPAGMARVILAVDRCDSADCSVGPSLFFDSTAFGPVPIGSEHTLGVAWDGNQTFTFTFDAAPPQAFTTAEPVAGPAKDPFKFIGTRAQGVDSAEGGSIRALFDDVVKNGVPYEDFQSVTLSGAKWQNPQELVKRNVGGAFESALARSGGSGGNNILNVLRPQLATTLGVDVTVTEVRRPAPGSRLNARLIGAFYNDGTPGGGEAGDVLALVQVSDLGDGSGLKGVFSVVRCLVPDCGQETVLVDDTTTLGPVALGTRHRLLLSFDGATFTFGLDDARATFTPGAAFPNAGPPGQPFKGIGTRVSPGAAAGGFISALFDNFVGATAPMATSLALLTGAGGSAAAHVRGFTTAGGPTGPSFLAYPAGFLGGVRVATGDVDGDGAAEVIAAPGPGGGPHVRIFSGPTAETVLAEFLAYDPGFTQGLFVAAGDVDGDGRADIVTGAGPGGGPHVKVTRRSDDGSLAELQSFFAYDPAFRGGIGVAACDLDQDGFADIVTGAGPGGGPHVQVFSGGTGAVLTSFLAYDPGLTSGIFVACGDVDGDGVPDIVTGVGPGGGPHVQAFSGRTGTVLASFFAYDPGARVGMRVAVGRVDGDGRAAIVTAPGAGGGPHVKAFKRDPDSSVAEVASFFAYDAGFLGGVFVAGMP